MLAMYAHTPNNYDCPLCHIAHGEVTERGNQERSVVFRDDYSTAFIAVKWVRSTPGDVLVIPNEHIESLYELPDAFGHRIIDASKQIVSLPLQ